MWLASSEAMRSKSQDDLLQAPPNVQDGQTVVFFRCDGHQKFVGSHHRPHSERLLHVLETDLPSAEKLRRRCLNLHGLKDFLEVARPQVPISLKRSARTSLHHHVERIHVVTAIWNPLRGMEAQFHRDQVKDKQAQEEDAERIKEQGAP